MRNKNIKVYSNCSTTLFERKKNVVKNICECGTKIFDSINLAKKFCRSVVDSKGLGSVVTV